MKYCIIPQPYYLEELEGCFRFRYDTTIVLGEKCTDKEYLYAQHLVKTIEEKMGFSIAIQKGRPMGSNEIYFEKTTDNEVMPDSVKWLLRMDCQAQAVSVPDAETERKWKIKTDSYRLRINENQITISANYANGILYGVQTLRQLISQLVMTIPCMNIEDKPSLPNRGFYHDATRGRVQKLDEYMKLAEKCAYYKLNQLQLYVEHSFMFGDFSEVWRDDTPLTAEDILTLDKYCSSIGVELVPSIASFGHLDKVLKTKSFASLCELEDSDKDRFSFRGRMEHHTINMTDPESWEFIKKMLDEFIPLFTSKQFNLCGDETFDLGKGRSRALAEEVGTHRIYVDFVRKICEYLISKNRRPMFWGDIIVGSPELLTELPKETICLTWGYSENESDNSAKTMDSVGAVQYLCPGVHGWRHFINKTSFAYANISKMCSYAKKYNALGVLNTDWGDYGHVSHPAFSVPGLIYGAEGSWSISLLSEAEENERISFVEYGDPDGEVAGVFSELGDLEAVTWNDIVNLYEFYREKDLSAFVEQKWFYENVHVTTVEEKNKKIRNCIDKLTDIAVRLDEKGKKVLYSYFLHAKGQELFNTAVACLGAPCFGMNILEREFGKEDRTKLASDIEKWFSAYKDNWRKTSRESELYRVQEVIFWYVDLLRTV